MRQITALGVAILCTLICVVLLQGKADIDAYGDYVGALKCKKCHERDGVYQSWSKSSHARAWESLDDEARENETCISCHSTGKTVLGELLSGVQCEACHGPGKDHKKLMLTGSEKEAKDRGISFVGEITCLNCHNENIPKEFRPEEPFDFEKAKSTGVHESFGKVEHELREP
jgi:nitrate/TMAO reductase-like tetraheme cytochrome c subunit